MMSRASSLRIESLTGPGYLERGLDSESLTSPQHLAFQDLDFHRENGSDSDGHHSQPQSRPTQPSHASDADPKFRDNSGPLFSMYSKIAEQEDDRMAESWQKDANGILIFTGLFSATVAVFLIMSVQDLRPNPQDTSAFYLESIFQILADPNGTVPRSSIPSALAAPPPFSPPVYAVWVNSLWFLSFVISLTCGLLATLLQQWSCRYVTVTQPPRCSPEKRARMRAFFANGVDKMHFPQAVQALPALLHLSYFIFFSGLVIFLFNVNHTVFTSVIWWIGLSSTIYVWITLMPIFRLDSPYYMPLSSTAWSLYTSVQHALFACLAFIAWQINSYRFYFLFRDLRIRYRRWMLVDIRKETEKTAMKRSPELDFHIFDWTMSALVDDDTLEMYLGTIPSFVNSKLAKVLKGDFLVTHYKRFWEAMCGFLGRTLLINPAIEPVKARRLVNCMNAMDVVPCPSHVTELIYRIIDERLDQVPLSIETGYTVVRGCTNSDGHISQYAKYCVSKILMAVKDRGHNWISLAKGQLGVPEDVLKNNMAHADDSLLLSIFINTTHQSLRSCSWSRHIVSSLSQIDIRNALPELQHEFCALWNLIVKQAHSEGPDGIWIKLLSQMRQAYIALHQGTSADLTPISASTPHAETILASPMSYPVCHLASHLPGWTTRSPAASSAFGIPSPSGDSSSGSFPGHQIHIGVEPPSVSSLEFATLAEMQGDSDRPSFLPPAYARLTHGSTPGDGPSLRRAGEMAVVVPSIIISDSPPTRDTTPDLPISHPSSTDPTVTQTDHIVQISAISSPSTIAVRPPATRDQSPPNPTDDLRSSSSAPSVADTPMSITRPDDPEHGQDEL